MNTGRTILRGGLLLLLTGITACDEASLPGQGMDSGQVNLPDSAGDSAVEQAAELPDSVGITSLPGSQFEIDQDADGADLVVDDGGIDWATVSPTIVWDLALDIPGDTSDTGFLLDDDSFGQGTKEDSPVPSVTSGSIPPNKSDLKQFGIDVESGPGGDFLHLFWTRVQDPTGTTNMDFEFNQAATDFVRTGGDLLIVYELSQGGTNPQLFLHRWQTGVAPWDGACEASNKYPCWGAQQSLAGVAIGSINNVALPVSNDLGIGPFDPRTFGEASIDLSSIFPDDECVSFGKAYLKSRSSDSFTSAVKDFIAPVDVNVTNCGRVIIRKETVPDGDTTSFDFTHNLVFESPPPQGTTFSLADGESIDFTGVFFNGGSNPSTYTITEQDLAGTGYTLDDIDCSASSGTVSVTETVAQRKIEFSLDQSSDVVDCTFMNEGLGSIIIEKKLTIDGQPSKTFGFTTSGAALSNFDLTVNSTTADTQSFLNIPIGSYEVTEDMVAGYKLTSLSCSGDTNSTVTESLVNRKATIQLAAGETITCTFENEPVADLKIIKQISGGGYTDVVFPFVASGADSDVSNFNLKSGEDSTYTDIQVGTYDFDENPPAGWRVKEINCTGNVSDPMPSVNTANGTLQIDVAAGESVECTFVNEPIGQLEIIKQIDGTGYSNVEFPYSASGPSIVTSPFSLFPSSGSPDNNDYGTVLAGNYDFDEDVPMGWRVKSISCTGNATNETVDLMAGTLDVDVAPGEDVTCTFVNEPIAGLRIIKQIDGSGYSNVQFDFTASGTDSSVMNFSLTPSSGMNDNQTWMNILAGTYSIDEDIPSGWRIKSINCTGNAASETSNTATGELSVDLGPGEFVECTYVNEPIATLTIRKELSDVDLGSNLFSFVSANAPGGNFDLTASGTTPDEKVYTDILAGTYNFQETIPTGWRLQSLSCTGNNTAEVASTVTGALAITLEAGENVVCTYVDEPLAQVSANFFSLGGSDVLQMRVECDTNGVAPVILVEEVVLDLATSNPSSAVPIGNYDCRIIVEAKSPMP